MVLFANNLNERPKIDFSPQSHCSCICIDCLSKDEYIHTYNQLNIALPSIECPVTEAI